jgi:predicted ATPase/class 3 adenylate cyclase
MAELPSGTVTFLYTDLEGSTARWEQAPAAMRRAVARHDALLRQAVVAHGGHAFRSTGDGLCAAFATAPAAVAAALAAQRALHAEAWGEAGPLRARMALHTGAAEVVGDDYAGACLNRVARLLSAGHGGQTLLSLATEELARDALPPGASLRDLGEHRLRDLVQPERVYQLLHADLPAEFPPPRSLDVYPHNLPLQLTSFVGRERELAEVARLLATTRLLTLTGAGGCGKTRLAVQAAADLVDGYADGAWLVELAPLADPDLVPQTVATALGVREQPGQPVLSTLLAALKPRRLLLALDNCEHLLDACARLADAVLRGCPAVRVLATSREALGIAGETAWRVPSLAVPTRQPPPPAEQVARYEAARLFVERAAAALPGFVVTDQNAPAVAQVCARLDGIPLAIELAAARVTVLSVEHLAERLDDRFRLLTGGSRTALPRQRTLRAAIDWSHALLADAERILLRRLSVFAGGWTLEAAEAVGAGDVIEAEAVLDLLARLVDTSLALMEVGAGGVERYCLLETVRQYAAERLAEAGETEVARARHAEWCLALAERAMPALHGPEQAVWQDRLAAETDNLRAAFAWRQGEAAGAEPALRLAGALGWFWYVRGSLAEGRDWLERALARGAAASPAARATALAQAGNLTFWLGDTVRAAELSREGLALCRAVGDSWGVAFSLMMLGHLAHRRGDLAAARSHFEQSLAGFRQLGDTGMLSYPLQSLARVARDQGDYGAARARFEQTLALRRQLGDARGIVMSTYQLGRAAYEQGDAGAARPLLEESLALARATGNTWTTMVVLNVLADLTRVEGDHARARRLLEESLALARQDGNRDLLAWTLHRLGRLALARGEAGSARADLQEGLELRRAMGHQAGIAAGLEGLAAVAVCGRQPGRAARLLGAATALRQAIGAPLPPVDRPDCEATAQAARAALGEAAFAAAWAAGEALTPEEAVAEALADDAI